MILRIFLSLVVHAVSAATAFMAVGAVHALSGRAIWAIFPGAYQVREISIYLVDALPFYVLIFAFISIAWQRIFGLAALRFGALLVITLVSVPVTVLVHQSFFPTSDRAIVLLTLLAIYYASALSVLQGVFALVRKSFCPLPLFPFAPAILPGLFTGFVLSVVYIGGFHIAQETGYLKQEAETYRPDLAPSSPEDHYRRAEMADDKLGAAPLPSLFTAEEMASNGLTDIGWGSVAMVDVDGDGFYDVVAGDAQESLDVWMNHDGVLKKADKFIAELSGQTIGPISFADYDRDGLMDLFIAQSVSPAQSAFETTRLKKLFWYFSHKPATTGRLFRQIKKGQWQDVTAAAFPGGAPVQFRKTEPIMWFDFNGDGRLDFVWSGYSHSNGGGQSLYIQNPDGSFTDKINETLSWSPGRIYAEGSDAADIDGDGDIDVFAYGYLFRNDNGRFVQVCGDQMPGVHCDTEARNEEGALFEDIDGDGALDFVLSYHGVGGIIPKYYLQLFRGQKSRPGKLIRDKAHERRFYGFNTYLRGKDFDFNGRPDVLTNDPGRLLTYYDDKWVDLLPAVSANQEADLWPLGWLDIDEDGDWDFLALRVSDGKAFLFRNNLNPERFMKISIVGAGGIENQYGATLKIRLPGNGQAVASYRPMAGYQGMTDPRLVYPLQSGHEYEIEVCFPSLKGKPSGYAKQENVRIEMIGVKGACATYLLGAADSVTRLDLTLMAGPTQ